MKYFLSFVVVCAIHASSEAMEKKKETIEQGQHFYYPWPGNGHLETPPAEPVKSSDHINEQSWERLLVPSQRGPIVGMIATTAHKKEVKF